MTAAPPSYDSSIVPLSTTLPEPAGSTEYRPSHASLMRDVELPATARPDGATVDAFVLATHRDPAHGLPGLELAVALARDLGSHLLVLCSGDSSAAAVRPLVDLPPAAVSIVDVPASPLALRLDGISVRLRTDDHPFATLARTNDVSVKRNLGLIAAVACGWDTVMLLDDDIRSRNDSAGLSSDALGHAAALLRADETLSAIGWTLDDFPDNSVAGHARRVLGEGQDIFLGTGSLMFRGSASLPFFPALYNEDWLFLIALAAAAGAGHVECLGRAGGLQQMPYDPFRHARAQSEETGDVIAEAMMNLLHDDGPALWVQARSRRHWRRAVSARREMLKDLRALAEEDGGDPYVLGRLRSALNAALGVHHRITAKACEQYVTAWFQDLSTWRRHLREIQGTRVGDDVEEFLGELMTGQVRESLSVPA